MRKPHRQLDATAIAARITLVAMLAMVVWAFVTIGDEVTGPSGELRLIDRGKGDVWLKRTAANLERFRKNYLPDDMFERWEAAWTEQPPEVSMVRPLADDALKLGLETLGMSIVAITFALFMAAPFVLPTARNIALGTLVPKSPRARGVGALVMGLGRLWLGVMRAIPEYIWVVIFVIAFQVGPLPGVLALGIHNSGVLAKLSSEALEDMSPDALRGLLATGASRSQLMVYGVVPILLPRFLSFAFYRWEVVIRATAIVGAVGGGGIGYRLVECIEVYPVQQHYTLFYLLLLLLIVALVDILSAIARRAIRRT